MPEPLVVEGVGHGFGAVDVLRDVSLSVREGELLALLGDSGSGKTTLLRAVAGLTTPARGRIVVGGQVVADAGRERVPTERRGVGLVFQDYALFPGMTARENVDFGAKDPADVAALLAATGLEALAERRPGQLSGGQQQRVALARALAARPHVLLLDEPFANVDASRRGDLAHEIRLLLAARGASAVLVTHDAQDAMAMADRIAVLDGRPGKIVQCDAPAEIYARPVDVATAARLGPCTWLAGVARGDTAETTLGAVSLVAPAEGRVSILVRPEQARLVLGDGDARVVAHTFVGRGFRLRVRAGTTEVLVDATSPAREASGRVVVDGPCWSLPAV
jgi:ABC-type Fe3+/spermidine/putrescine transport system ATPase subunit